MGHCNVCKPMTKWDTLMCDPSIWDHLSFYKLFRTMGGYKLERNAWLLVEILYGFLSIVRKSYMHEVKTPEINDMPFSDHIFH